MADESLSDLVNTAEQHVQEQTDALEQIVADLDELQRTVNTLSNITGEYTVDASLYQCYTLITSSLLIITGRAICQHAPARHR